MTKINLHKLFYKDYFASPKPDSKLLFTFGGIEAINKQIIDSKFEDFQHNAKILEIGNESFELTTKYPGLLVGAGYDHETHAEKEFKLGFSFDFTTGLPIIPGSSVKGVLRSAFRKKVNNEEFGLIKALLKTIKSVKEDVDYKVLERELFGDPEDDSTSMSKRDIFHDAIIVPTHTGLFMANDFITPHRNRDNPELSPFSNPIPLPFLKIRPNVAIRFQFDMRERTETTLLTIAERKKLYSAILQLLGIGAKTRVGYGKFK